MDIERATRLKIGDRVACPPDRKQPGFLGRVTATSPIIATRHDGVEYLWIEVANPEGRRAQWPSNRLGTTMGALRACAVVAA